MILVVSFSCSSFPPSFWSKGLVKWRIVCKIGALVDPDRVVDEQCHSILKILLNDSYRFHSEEEGKCCLSLGTFPPFPCNSAHKNIGSLPSLENKQAPGYPQRPESRLFPRNVNPCRPANPKTEREGGDPWEYGEPGRRRRTHLHAGLLDRLHQEHLVGGPLLVVDAVLHHRGRPRGWVVGRWDFHSCRAAAGRARVCS